MMPEMGLATGNLFRKIRQKPEKTLLANLKKSHWTGATFLEPGFRLFGQDKKQREALDTFAERGSQRVAQAGYFGEVKSGVRSRIFAVVIMQVEVSV
jgi:hypothetical protein